MIGWIRAELPPDSFPLRGRVSGGRDRTEPTVADTTDSQIRDQSNSPNLFSDSRIRDQTIPESAVKIKLLHSPLRSRLLSIATLFDGSTLECWSGANGTTATVLPGPGQTCHSHAIVGTGKFVQSCAVDRCHFTPDGLMYFGETLWDFMDMAQTIGVVPRNGSWQFKSLTRLSAVPGHVQRIRNRIR